MKKFAITLLALTFLILGSGRFIKNWTYQELFDHADLVVVGMPISTQDTNEPGGPPEWPDVQWVMEVNTEFQVSVVMKGDKALKKFTLHHYRFKDKRRPVNAPNLVAFDPPFTPETSGRFLLFLKLQSDGRYAPVSGQLDPASIDVVKLDGMAK